MSTYRLPTTPRIDDTRLAAWRSFLEVHARIVDVLSEELAEGEGVSLQTYDVLVHLSEAPEWRLRMQELADAVLLSKSGLTRLIDRMESSGLVDRVPCDDDRRGTYARLTPQGFATLKRCAPLHAEGVGEHFADLLDDDEAAVLRDVLDRIATHLRDAGD